MKCIFVHYFEMSLVVLVDEVCAQTMMIILLTSITVCIARSILYDTLVMPGVVLSIDKSDV